MFSIGNIKPLKSIVGNNIPIKDMSIATCCELVLMEINIPNVKQAMINSILSAKSKRMFPFIGRSNTKTLNNNMVATFTRERIR